ncbi:MAG TPA: cysteine desulfurase family protein [Candidatus Saccharimonadales bacterium]|nr:cysteine desulfurase family protein [Candidatus Saccharimonadales bacterium]
MSKTIYLDYAAATPMDGEVFAAMRPYFTDKFHNPSATYLAGRAARRSLEEMRGRVAAHLGCRSAEVIFTAGATEANNLAIQGVMRAFPEGEILVSAVEHESVLAPARLFTNHEIAVNKNGILDLDDLKKKIGPRTVLISVMYVNNEIGSIQPLKEITQLVADIRRTRLTASDKTPLYLHTDAAQAGNFFDLHVARLGVDLMSINGGKLYGPKQSGALFVKAGTRLQPLVVGGGQEFGYRSGTENLAAIAGFAKAMDESQAVKKDEFDRLMRLRKEFESSLLQQIPQAVINGGKHRAPHIVSVSLPGHDNERLMMQLDEAGIICAVGSACSASRDEPSHVLAAIGLSEEDARSTLRFSLGRQTTEEDLHQTVKVLTSLLK